jgi:pimeloyl-ACP methyl ester carboxylesterase
MLEVELSAGTIEYENTGGDNPMLVLLHGVAVNGSLWRGVVSGLREDHRCVVPTLQLGGHRRPMKPYADLSIRAMVRLVAEFLRNLTNLKAVLFFATFLTQFVDSGRGSVALQLLALGLILQVVGLVVDVAIGLAAGTVEDVFVQEPILYPS